MALVVIIFSRIRMNSSLFNIVSLIWMKTQPIIITLITKFAINNFGMESSCVNSILKLLYVNSKLKNVKSPSIDSKVDLSIGYFRPKLFLTNFRLEFVAKPKIPFGLLERYLLVESQLFNQSLLKFDRLKMPFGLVVLYSNFQCQ